MNNAAIIIFKRSTLPRILKFFAVPLVNQIIDLDNEGNIVRVYAIEYPVIEYSPDNRRAEKFLYSLCMENKISFFIVRNIKYYSGSSLEHLESRIKRGDIDEIKAVKDKGALIKLSLRKLQSSE